MTPLDRRLSAAVSELEADLRHTQPPPFRPGRRVPPALVVALVVAIAAVGFAVIGNRADDSGQSVATTPDSAEQEASADVGEVIEGALTDAASGEFFVLVPGVSAWNADESMMLLYRTGTATPGHVVLDTRTAEVIGALAVTPPDIEQIYWSPVDPGLLYTTIDNALVSLDATNPEGAVPQTLYTFEGCDRVDSGRLPVPPSGSGTIFGLLCYSLEGTQMVAVDLSTGTEVRSPAPADVAPMPSPSGEHFVVWNGDRSASVLTQDLVRTGIDLDLNGDLFHYVIDSDGQEAVAAALYEGEIVGSLVIVPLDGGASEVIVGPATGYAYPPPGTSLSTSGSQVAVSIAAPADVSNSASSLAGQVHLVGLDSPSGIRSAIEHESEGRHDYWSNPFVSLSPTGRYLAYSSDQGSDRVNTFIHVVTD